MNINKTGIIPSDRIIRSCQVVDLGSGSYPRTITVRLPFSDGATKLVRWDGSIPLAVNDYISIQRIGTTNTYEIYGSDGSTAFSAPAPVDAQYYVAALDVTLTNEIVPSIDTFKVSKLRASDDSADALTADADAILTAANILILPNDVFPYSDTEFGLGTRIFSANGTLEDHFVGTTLDASWTWAGAPFATPDEASMTAIPSCLQLAFTSGTDPRSFLYKSTGLSSTPTRLCIGFALNNPTDLSFCGYRADDSSDNNYVEAALRKVSGSAAWELISRYRTGGGAVTTTVHQTFDDIPKFMYVRLRMTGTAWTNWAANADVGIDSPALSAFTFASGLTWTPSRRGPCFTSIGSPPTSFRGPYIDWVTTT